MQSHSDEISPRQSQTPEGYLICHGVPIARVGQQLYAAEELPELPSRGGVVVVDRPEAAVFEPAAIASAQ